MNSTHNFKRIDVIARENFKFNSQNTFYSIGKSYLLEDHIESSEELLNLLHEPVSEELHLEYKPEDFTGSQIIVEISFRQGVTDNTASSLKSALGILGLKSDVFTSQIYRIKGDVNQSDINNFFKGDKFNPLVHKMIIYKQNKELVQRFKSPLVPSISVPQFEKSNKKTLNYIDLKGLNDQDLLELTKRRCLALNLQELRVLKNYTFPKKRGELNNAFTDVELEVIAQTWSEHCKHKIFSSVIEYTDSNENKVYIDSLYKSFIKETTKSINPPWLVSVFEDNAGIVSFDKNINISVKVETHNSPSALDPYGGALTGILGVNRDILGTGLGSIPIANLDVFCFPEPNIDQDKYTPYLPKNMARAKDVLTGVHKGVIDGGNKSGIPTVNGAFFFDDSYAAKPLVYVGTVGAMKKKTMDKPTHIKKANPGDFIMIIGGGVGKDGIHGATFSSLEIDENALSSTVQIGDPFMQKKVSDLIKYTSQRRLYTSITDNGAGGISSSIGEMATESGGAFIELSKCHTKYEGLLPYEIMISESQERMTLAVNAENIEQMKSLCSYFDVPYSIVGNFTDSGYLHATYEGRDVCYLSLDFLHNGLPKLNLKATKYKETNYSNWLKKSEDKKELPNTKKEIEKSIHSILSSYNVASKEDFIRQYDHEVGGATTHKAFCGKNQNPINDSGAIKLENFGGEKNNAISIATGLAPRISVFNPSLMAKMSVDECMRNLVSTGVNPSYICLLDNFCWPDPIESQNTPDGKNKLGALVEACQGLKEICEIYQTPFVSGKDSMKNDFKGKNNSGESLNISILPTLLITGVGKIDTNHLTSSAFKNCGDIILEIGLSPKGLKGSEFAKFYQISSHDNGPEIKPKENLALYYKLHELISQGIIKSCHDISEGGSITSICESLFGEGLGALLTYHQQEGTQEKTKGIESLITQLFSEAPGRFIISIAKDNLLKVTTHIKHYRILGEVTNTSELIIKYNHQSKQETLKINYKNLYESWISTFKEGVCHD